MKKLPIIFFVIISLCTTVFVTLGYSCNHGGCGDSKSIPNKFVISPVHHNTNIGNFSNRNDVNNNNNNVNTNNNTNTNTNTNLNYNVNVNSNKAVSSAEANSNNNNQINILNQRDFLAPGPIDAFEMPAIVNGKIGNYTNLPMFAHVALTPLDFKNDLVVKVIDVYSGWFMSRIRLEDIESLLLDKADVILSKVEENQRTKIRYAVQFKDNVTTGGAGGGMNVSGSQMNADSGSAGALSVLPGYHSTTHNPQFLVKFYLVK